MNRRFFLKFISSTSIVSVLSYLLNRANAREISKGTPRPKVFYVSTTGNDLWSGLNPAPTGEGSGPFASLTRAKNAIRELKARQGGKLQQPVTVFVRGGTYFIDETIDFDVTDSGTKQTPILYKAYQKEKPIISGGKMIKGWKRTTINGKLAWTATIPAVNTGKWSFHQLWVDGKRARPCRYPKQGYFNVEGVADLPADWRQGQDRFQYRQGDIKAWPDFANGEIIIMSRWLESRLAIKDIDERQRIVTLDENTPIRIEAGRANSSGAGIFYLENIRDFLTEAGEYYIDRVNGEITYLPLPGREKSVPQAIAPKLEKIIQISGDNRSAEFVEHIFFDGLTFSHGEWYYPDNRLKTVVKEERIFGFYPNFKISQNNDDNLNVARVHFSGGFAAFGVPGFISTKLTRNCGWNKCVFSHLGVNGIDLAGNSIDNQITNCNFNDLGAGAIKIGSVKKPSYGGNKVSGCHIYDGGLIFHSAVGIWIGKSSNNLVSKNHIHHFYYTGIAAGWNWGFLPKPQESKNIIENNHVHHIGTTIKNKITLLNDKAGVYVLGNQPNTIIRDNRIHDIDAYNYAAFGIYLDSGSSNILVTNNVVYNTRDGGLTTSSTSRDNSIINNIFAYGRLTQLYILANSENINRKILTFEKNIVYWEEGELFFDNFKYSQDINLKFDSNIYWKSSDKNERGFSAKFGKHSWEKWRSKGMDRNSRIVDPLFVAPAKRDFRLRPESPARKLGFKPIAKLASQ